MTRTEIKSKFDEIVDFAGVGRYIDTPVKRYSSGMYVRLAFAVAAHLESEILIVDEVLAVGDAEFQKKCLGKMQDVSKGEGRTVLFVSHNMGAMSQLCNSSLLLSNGQVHYSGEIRKGIEKYISIASDKSTGNFQNESEKSIDILSINCNNSYNGSNIYSYDENIQIEIIIKTEIEIPLNTIIGLRLVDQLSRIIFTTESKLVVFPFLNNKMKKVLVTIPRKFLVPNMYFPTIAIHIPHHEIFCIYENKVAFSIEETGSDLNTYSDHDYGCVFANCVWE